MTSIRDIQRAPVNILLVEDDDGDAKAVQRAFQKAKVAHSVVRAIDGEDALEMLKGQNGKPTTPSPFIVIADLNMPRMNGIEMVKEMRADARLKHSIVFILTTSRREEDKTAAYDLNVAGYIEKSTAGRDFLSLVNLICSYETLVELPVR